MMVSRLLPKKIALLVVAVLLLSVVAFSGCGNHDRATPHFSEDVVERLDSAVASTMEIDDVPGVVVGVWVPGEGEYIVARGKANLKTGEQRDIDDPFRIASITKTFVATAILQLVDEGKLSKSDTLSRWYPDFPNADQITVEDLLRMRSGLVDPTEEDMWESEEEFWEAYEKNHHADFSTTDMIELAASKSAEEGRPPGQRTEYTNINYILLGEIVEKESGEDLGTYLTQNILKPLKMNNTLYPLGDDLPGDLHSYTWNNSTGELEDTTIINPAIPAGAGAMISDIWNLKTWAEAACTGKLLEPETHRARLRTQPLGEGWPAYAQYGEGIVKMGPFCGHPGSLLGFGSQMWYLPQRDATIVVSVNAEDLSPPPPAEILAQTIMKILFPKYASW
jgi:D-alanyl-D-alanine carboxypeptidase